MEREPDQQEQEQQEEAEPQVVTVGGLPWNQEQIADPTPVSPPEN